MIITAKHLSRRAALRGLGVTVGLPLLDAMIPAASARAKTAAAPPCRLAAIEIVHGSAGSTDAGRAKNYWSPAMGGRDFVFTDTLRALEPLRDYLTIISNTQLHNAMSLVPEEDGPMVDHARSSAVFLTGAHPRRTTRDGVRVGPSIDQIYARKIGRETPIPSLQLCIEDNTLTGECASDYSCAYAHTISWAQADRPLPMEIAPRAVFDRLFLAGNPVVGGGSILDPLTEAARRLGNRLGQADRSRVAEYLDAVRAVERHIQDVEERNASGQPRALAGLPQSVPDTFEAHASLMFDLQWLAFAADLTRVTSFKLSVDRSQRIYLESGVATPFHTLSHHGYDPDKLAEYAKLNAYHVSKLAGFLKRLGGTADGDGTLLDHAVVLYGSPMGDSHVHAHRFLPLLLAGHANGGLKGNLHLACTEDTAMANALLTVLHKLGVEADQIGDSTGTLAI